MIRTLTIGVMLVLLVLAVPVGADAPVRISYVYSDSMLPTIDQGDGYLIVATDDVGVGDIVTYWSPERGTFVTHRVVDITAAGLITKGDNNPTTDQAAGYPAVRPDQLVGKVVTIDGRVLLVPNLQALDTAVENNQSVIAGLIALYAYWRVRGYRRRNRGADTGPRRTIRLRQIAVPGIVGTMVVLAALIYVGSSTLELTYVASEQGGESATLLKVGESKNTTVLVDVVKTPFTQVIVDADGMNITGIETVDERGAASARFAQGVDAVDESAGMESTNPLVQRLMTPSVMLVDVQVPALDEPGVRTGRVLVYPYPSTLPTSVLAMLHDIHPLVAAIGSSVATFAPMYVFYWLFYDGNEPVRLSIPGVTR